MLLDRRELAPDLLAADRAVLDLEDVQAARKAGEAAPQVRAGRRRDWLEVALAPLKETLPPERWQRLQKPWR